MVETFFIFGSVLAVSAVSLVGAVTLSIREALLRRLLFVLVALATGAMLGNVFLHLLPEAYKEAANSQLAALFVLAGVLFFFVLEKILHWQHAHPLEEHPHEHESREEHTAHMGPLVLIGDGVHNITDGFIIAAAYLISIEVGIATTVAVILHEVPQEIGDFGLLLHVGYTRLQALFWNFGSALTAFAGAALGLFLSEVIANSIPYIAAFAAGNLLYIAVSDLLPELRKVYDVRRSLLQLALLIAGATLMALLLQE